MNSQELQDKIASGIDVEKVIIDTQDNVHFFATIISKQFEGKSQLARQRLIYEILNEDISSGLIHAISLKTYTEQEWENIKCEN